MKGDEREVKGDERSCIRDLIKMQQQQKENHRQLQTSISLK